MRFQIFEEFEIASEFKRYIAFQFFSSPLISKVIRKIKVEIALKLFPHLICAFRSPVPGFCVKQLCRMDNPTPCGKTV